MGLESSKSSSKVVVESNYFPKGGYIVSTQRLEAIARILLMGVYDDDNPLSVFRGMRYLIQKIWEYALQFNRHHYALTIDVKQNQLLSHGAMWSNQTSMDTALTQVNLHEGCQGRYISDESTMFPKPLQREININMMPIEMNKEKLKAQLPRDLRGYIGLIEACCDVSSTINDTICFLTIHESFVEQGRTQRRPGLHVELPGRNVDGNARFWWAWGGGYNLNHGIYMASNVSGSCVAWNCLIDESIVGELGEIEYLRSSLPNGEKYYLEANQLYWITDKTPHEALPMEKSGWRQFFRLVSSKLGIWYEQHSTKNPMGIVPDKTKTKIVKGNKFHKKSKK